MGHISWRDDFDNRFISYFADEFKKDNGIDFAKIKWLFNAQRNAEKAKHEFQAALKQMLICPSLRPMHRGQNT
ncbi:MAG: hypothetical protein Ct9H300mP21_07740 [Pseudomonadota bacterium]|nr:MAG: hypothetical protein Ct9H300mP21_07740 [Pseudomonadota bacterium]